MVKKTISKLKKELDKWFSLFGQGEQYKFSVALDSKYGDGTSEELELKARTIMKVSRIDYEEKISYYKEAVNKLKKEKGIE